MERRPIILNQQTTFHPSVNNIKKLKEVKGTFFYYARAVDPTILTALGSIAAQKANPTEQTMPKSKQLLDYVASHLDAILTFQSSEMALAGHSNASYLT